MRACARAVTTAPPIASASSGERHGVWAATRLEARREKVAQFFLEEAGYEVYLPLVRWRTSRTRATRLSALLPGYIFVRVEQLRREEPGALAAHKGIQLDLVVELAGVQAIEIGDAVDAEHDGLTVDDKLLVPILKRSLDDPREAASLIG
jgi:hypothetical protein